MRPAGQWLLANATLDDPLTVSWTSHALYQCGGRVWNDWTRKLLAMPGQQPEGDDAGSFEPAAGGSRAVTSALRVLSLEAYYRYTKLVR